MRTITVALDQIVCDLRGRTLNDITQLIADIRRNGLLKPLEVEGPTADGKYHLIKGYRRYAALQYLYPGEVKVRALVLRGSSTFVERMIERLRESFDRKKMTGIDKKLLVKDILEEGNMTEKELARLLNKDVRTIRNMVPSSQVPEFKRKEVAKIRGSQMALDMIYLLEVEELYREDLYNRLINGKITGDHGAALKRLMGNKHFRSLDHEQRISAIEETLRQAKFTEENSEIICMMELMKGNPSQCLNLLDDWINYQCSVFEKLEKVNNPLIPQLVITFQKRKMRKALGKLIQSYIWLWDDLQEEETS